MSYHFVSFGYICVTIPSYVISFLNLTFRRISAFSGETTFLNSVMLKVYESLAAAPPVATSRASDEPAPVAPADKDSLHEKTGGGNIEFRTH